MRQTLSLRLKALVFLIRIEKVARDVPSYCRYSYKHLRHSRCYEFISNLQEQQSRMKASGKKVIAAVQKVFL
jgi:hypothetical protein